jgi:uncharacterized membrane protein YhaH (DUF805 family)
MIPEVWRFVNFIIKSVSKHENEKGKNTKKAMDATE